ncbi:multidrug efflux MFS transporter [Streptacidiphilus sp. PB12-B1b]|uniref:MFS transporter n=1 Tax=Streptacidiphilus sp. PB12-B1b TaxID=2705012 RepID=UPI0015FC1C89|nr:MFS transporter [Streptacidiphilus sp. PB12-B1b]QMU78626.1 multidrug efflux MFS transporter [Streptacidiphilus sp. PB12-B1b]
MIDTRRRRTALLVAGCFFMEMLDGTIVSTAAPQIGASLHTAPASVGLVITSYLLTVATLIPLSGWLALRFGPRRILLGAIALFTLASLACAGCDSLGQLVAMRVLQGVGGAMMVPVGRMAVLGRAEKPDIPRLMAYIVWPGLVAPVVAPLAGGVITTYADWHWLFLVNLPLGAAAFAVAWRLVTPGPRQSPPPLDWAGVLLSCAGLAGATWTAHLFSESRTPWATAAALAALSALALAAAARHLLRTPHPLVNLRVLADRGLRSSVVGGSLYWLVVGAVPFLLPLLFEEVFGWSAVKSGAVVLFVFVGNIGIKPATTGLLNRYGFRPLLVLSTACLAATVVGFAFLTAGTPVALIAALAAVSGAARSVGLTGYSVLAMSEIPPERMSDANTLSATFSQTAAGFGVAVATVGLRLGGEIGSAPGTAYGTAFGLLALLALLATADAVRLHPTAGDAVRHRAAGSAPQPAAEPRPTGAGG